MFNFVLIMGRKDASLKINLGVPFKTNERQAQATSDKRGINEKENDNGRCNKQNKRSC